MLWTIFEAHVGGKSSRVIVCFIFIWGLTSDSQWVKKFISFLEVSKVLTIFFDRVQFLYSFPFI